MLKADRAEVEEIVRRIAKEEIALALAPKPPMALEAVVEPIIEGGEVIVPDSTVDE